jgi:hypothetical protein
MKVCPFLPVPASRITAADAQMLDSTADAVTCYEFRLAYAQSKLADGLPAQAILQLNRAFSADLGPDAEILKRWPLPYAAVAWILDARPDRTGLFLGNPRRHWQHYATRMSGSLRELRIWRSWACCWLCHGRLPEDEFPFDQQQIEHEHIRIPHPDAVARQLDLQGMPGEARLWQEQLLTQ